MDPRICWANLRVRERSRPRSPSAQTQTCSYTHQILLIRILNAKPQTCQWLLKTVMLLMLIYLVVGIMYWHVIHYVTTSRTDCFAFVSQSFQNDYNDSWTWMENTRMGIWTWAFLPFKFFLSMIGIWDLF